MDYILRIYKIQSYEIKMKLSKRLTNPFLIKGPLCIVDLQSAGHLIDLPQLANIGCVL